MNFLIVHLPVRLVLARLADVLFLAVFGHVEVARRLPVPHGQVLLDLVPDGRLVQRLPWSISTL